MTMHYSDTITADEVIEGWNYNGKGMPLAYGVFSKGDWVAYSTWSYLCLRKERPDAPSVDEYCEKLPQEQKDLIVPIMKEVIQKLEANNAQKEVVSS